MRHHVGESRRILLRDLEPTELECLGLEHPTQAVDALHILLALQGDEHPPSLVVHHEARILQLHQRFAHGEYGIQFSATQGSNNALESRELRESRGSRDMFEPQVTCAFDGLPADR
jgi:hypothetical protein